MILQMETLLKYGYLPLDLKPKSNKLILAACDKCGKVRETSKNYYYPLCQSCAHKGRIFTEEHKAKLCENHADFTGKNHPGFGKHCTDIAKAKMSIAKKGKKNCNWRGGISFEPYCIKFDEAYKQLIRNKFDNRCFWCGLTPEENGRALDVHHVNYNKQCGCDESKCICVPLCRRCHSKTNTDRDGWQEKIMKKLELSGILWGN
jgi:hypothetical protein